jgi:hypothetical protein
MCLAGVAYLSIPSSLLLYIARMRDSRADSTFSSTILRNGSAIFCGTRGTLVDASYVQRDNPDSLCLRIATFLAIGHMLWFNVSIEVSQPCKRMCMLDSKVRSPKQTKHMAGCSSLHTDRMAALRTASRRHVRSDFFVLSRTSPSRRWPHTGRAPDSNLSRQRPH